MSVSPPARNAFPARAGFRRRPPVIAFFDTALRAFMTGLSCPVGLMNRSATPDRRKRASWPMVTTATDFNAMTAAGSIRKASTGSRSSSSRSRPLPTACISHSVRSSLLRHEIGGVQNLAHAIAAPMVEAVARRTEKPLRRNDARIRAISFCSEPCIARKRMPQPVRSPTSVGASSCRSPDALDST